jgi:DNA-binding transcriptional regulator YbjK
MNQQLSSSPLLAAVISRVLHRLRYLVCYFYGDNETKQEKLKQYLNQIGVVEDKTAVPSDVPSAELALQHSDEKKKLMKEKRQKQIKEEMERQQQLFQKKMEEEEDKEVKVFFFFFFFFFKIKIKGKECILIY